MNAPGPGHGAPSDVGFGTTRIEALSDGIFAVAMTLLVLDVKLPVGESFASSQALFDRLISLEHTFVIYFITFVVLAMFWVGHHAQFHYIRYVDHTLLWINLLFLFGITSMPFATDMLGDHNHLVLPYLYYGAKFLFLAGLLVLQVIYLRSNPKLAHSTLTHAVARRIVVRTVIFATIPVLSMVAVFYNRRLALYLYFLLLVVHFLPGRVDILKRSDGAGQR
jgi:uncharacterized membrane protein